MLPSVIDSPVQVQIWTRAIRRKQQALSTSPSPSARAPILYCVQVCKMLPQPVSRQRFVNVTDRYGPIIWGTGSQLKQGTSCDMKPPP